MGVPESTPVPLSVRPGGSVPVLAERQGAGAAGGADRLAVARWLTVQLARVVVIVTAGLMVTV